MKSAFVTGASRGLGLGFVEVLLSQGFQVFAGVLDPSLFASPIKENPNLHIMKLDVTDDIQIKNAFDEVSKLTSSLDLLINNAGVNKDTATNNHKELVCNLDKLDRGLLLKMVEVNAVSPMMITKYFLPLLKSDPSFIINISSCRASFHDEWENLYADYGYRASKSALNIMTFYSTMDLPKNIQTFAVHPGDMKTDMNPNGEQDPRDQAKAIMKITENWDNSLNGKYLRYDGSLYPL